MKTVSIIIPVYNAEKYLTQCVRSVLQQSYPALQVLLVNDGSTDKSLTLCQSLAKKDDRIRVLDKPNGGVSSARNAGLAVATGTYVQFLDSDDTIHKDMVKTLVDLLEAEDADIAFCAGEALYYSKGRIAFRVSMIRSSLGDACPMSHQEFLSRLPWLLTDYGGLEAPCNRIYRRKLITDAQLQFPTYTSFGEDFLFNVACYGACRKVVFTDKALYYYHRRDRNSLSCRCIPDLYANQMHLIDTLCQMLAQQSTLTPAAQQQLDLYRCWYLYDVLENIATAEELSYQERWTRLQNLLNDDSFRQRYLACDFEHGHSREFAPYVKARDPAGILEWYTARQKQALEDAKHPITCWVVRRLRHYAKHHPNTRTGHLAQLLQLNLATVGPATTFARIRQKLLRGRRAAP